MNRLLRTSVRTSSKIWPNKIEASDPGGWDFVEAILPPIQIPTPDMNQKFPTPSGWQPPAQDLLERNYPVKIISIVSTKFYLVNFSTTFVELGFMNSILLKKSEKVNFMTSIMIIAMKINMTRCFDQEILQTTFLSHI